MQGERGEILEEKSGDSPQAEAEETENKETTVETENEEIIETENKETTIKTTNKTTIETTVKTENKETAKQPKPSLRSLETAMVAAWRTDRKEQAEDLHRRILKRAQEEEVFRRECLDSFERMSYNAAFFKPKMGAEGKRIAILGAKNAQVGEWDPSGVENGMAGSEEAVVYAGEVLAAKGYRVTIYMNPPHNSPWRLPTSNPVYKDCDLFEKEMPNSPDAGEFDAVIVWRQTHFHVARRRSQKVFFWPHDLASFSFNCGDLSGVFFLSEFHRRQMVGVCPGLARVPCVISGNGIRLEEFQAPKRFANPYSCIYASNYSRGLAVLLEIWPEVRREFPSATLDVYYGRQTWGTLKPEEEKELFKKLESLRAQGVTEKGQVGHRVLAEAMQQVSIWAYPCTTEAETFCITAVKAQAAGMVPVTTRVGALKETVHPKAPVVEKITKAKEYRDRLLAVMRRIEKAGGSRDEYIEFAQKFTWEACVEKWLSLIETPEAAVTAK